MSKLKVTGKEWFWFKMRYIMPKRSFIELSKPNGVFERFMNGECK